LFDDPYDDEARSIAIEIQLGLQRNKSATVAVEAAATTKHVSTRKAQRASAKYRHLFPRQKV
jgi:hypothetical protein